MSFELNSLKLFNEDLNTLEVFAYAHDEAEKLSAQLLLDTANRLPVLLKQRYIDYLDKKGLNSSHPGFDSLRDFVVHEIKLMTSDYAQAFFKTDSKDKEGQSSSRSKGYRVHQVTVGSGNDQKGTGSAPATNRLDKGKKLFSNKRFKDKPLPNCFVCARPDLKHCLVDCEKFKAYSHEAKRQKVIDAKR